MKKTIKIFAILLLAIVLLSGCVKLDCEVAVKEDGSAKVSYVVAISKELLEASEESTEGTTEATEQVDLKNTYLDSLEEVTEDAQAEGFSIEEYETDEYLGHKLTKEVDNVADIPLEKIYGAEVIKDSDDNKIKFEKDGSKIVISQNAVFDLTNYYEGYYFTYSVELPVEVTENNATKVEGNKLTWEFTAGEKEDVNFKAEGRTGIFGGTSESKGNMMWIIIGIVAVIVLVVVAVMVFGKKGNKKEVKNVETQPSETKKDEKVEQSKTETTPEVKPEEKVEEPKAEESKIEEQKVDDAKVEEKAEDLKPETTEEVVEDKKQKINCL